MKKFKKVIPALCMLLVSAIMLGSTTYAWFSMNNKVTVGTMSVEAKSNSQFLVISKTNTLGALTALSTTSENESEKLTGNGGDNGKVFPSAKADADFVAAHSGAGIAENDWYTANSTVHGTVGSGDTLTNIKKIGTNSDPLTNYHITYTFYIGLAANSTDYTGKLSIKNSGSFANGAKAIVTIGDKSHTFSNEEAGETWDIESINLTTTATQVTVTLYVDGNVVTSSTAATAIAGSLNMEFTIGGSSSN